MISDVNATRLSQARSGCPQLASYAEDFQSIHSELPDVSLHLAIQQIY
jgi:hypothetical protein